MATVNQGQVDALTEDFNKLLDDVMVVLPPSSQRDMAVMLFKIAESAVITMAKQLMASKK